MNCQTLRHRLKEFVRGEFSSQDEQAALEHIATCEDCRYVLGELAGSLGSAERLLTLAGAYDGPGPNCPAPEVLSAYVAGVCDASDAGRVAQHATTCSFCARELDELSEFHDTMARGEPVAHAPKARSVLAWLRGAFWGAPRWRTAAVAVPAAAAVVLIVTFALILPNGPTELSKLAPQLDALVQELTEHDAVDRAPAIHGLVTTRGVPQIQLAPNERDTNSFVLVADLSGSGWHAAQARCSVWDVTELRDSIDPESVEPYEMIGKPERTGDIDVHQGLVEWKAPLRPGRVYLWLIQAIIREGSLDDTEESRKAVFVATDIRHLLPERLGEKELLQLIAFYERTGLDGHALEAIRALEKLDPSLASRLRAALEE